MAIRRLFSSKTTPICSIILYDDARGKESQILFSEMNATVGAQSIARLYQNLVNCRRNISAYRRPRKLRFFLIERSLAGEWFKILTNINTQNIFLWNPFESAYKKTVHFEGKYAYKKFEKAKFKKKNWRDSSLVHNKFIFLSNSFLPLHLMFMWCFKITHSKSLKLRRIPL